MMRAGRGEAMSEVLGTERIGQLTGSTAPGWPQTKDPMHWPLLNETGRCGVNGVDLGANTEHNGRLYIFFGDVAIDNNPDTVCWTTDTVVQRHGGHLALGWDFRIPNDHQGAGPATGQWDWRLCEQCHGMFYCPRAPHGAGVCPAGGTHSPIGWNFVLPNHEQGASTGQNGWRHCSRCEGLCYAPGGDAGQTKCPAGGQHDVRGSWDFYLPALETGASVTMGQPEWRFCANCHSLFWNGDSIKGVCPGAVGGGFRLNAVLDPSGRFAPFVVDPPIGLLGPNETPTGAFIHAGRAYVFVWVGPPPRPWGGPAPPGSYLTSKADPSTPGRYRVEQSISPLDFTRPNTGFNQIAAVRVDNAVFSGLFPSSTGTGLVMFGHGHNVRLGESAIHLAWSPLVPNPDVGPLSMWYYTGDSNRRWSRDPNDAIWLLPRPGIYTSVSAAWLPGPQRWILIYGKANPIDQSGPVDGPVMARLARTPFEVANVPDIPIFDPVREHAYGNYMHQPGLDRIHPDLPPAQPPGHNDPGWAYGAFLLERFTQWDPRGLIELYYLLSTASPYQVHLMYTRIRFA
jgi:hypothetical protein